MAGFLSRTPSRRCASRPRSGAVSSRLLPAALLALALAWPAVAREPPELRFEAPAVLAPQALQLESLDSAGLVSIMELLGLEHPGPPIRVLLAREGSPEARRAPSWAVAYAVGGASLVVLIPSRVPGYPDDTIDTVLRHEVAHVLIARAAGQHRIPRWFNEGLAIYGSRGWGLEDRARLTLATFRRGGLALGDLDRRFQGGAHSAAGAYALSAAFVRFLLDRHGPLVAARILDRMAHGDDFSGAFQRAVGYPLLVVEDHFWHHLDIWSKWVPLLGSSSTLWMLITSLALWAFKRRRARDAEQLATWDLEERRRLEQVSTEPWVH